MRNLVGNIKFLWLFMLEPPWRVTGDRVTRTAHWLMWSLGWAWAIAGLVLGALVAPSLVSSVGLSNSPYQDWFVIGVATLTGFVSQVLGRYTEKLGRTVAAKIAGILLSFVNSIFKAFNRLFPPRTKISRELLRAYFILADLIAFLWLYMFIALLPLVGVGYAIYRFLILVGTSQREVTIAFVGSLLVKTFLIPFIKGIVTGALFKWFLNWLRGGKETKTT